MKKGISKEQILSELLKVIQMTRAGEDVADLQLDSESYVVVRYKNSGTKKVSIEADSGIAMVRDICQVIN